MKQWCFLLLSVFCLAGRGQTFTVGSTCCNYQWVNYTFTTVTTPTTAYNYSSTDNYAFDVDGDLTDDIQIISYYYRSAGGSGYEQKRIEINSGTNVECVFTHSVNYYCPYSKTINNLSFGLPLVSNMNWIVPNLSPSNGQPAPFVYYYSLANLNLITFECIPQTNPFYIGFRKVLPSTDTIYGWIRMNSYFPGKVYDYAFMNTNLATTIHSNNNIAAVSLFPNPNSGEFEIKGIKDETIFITNELGQLIATKDLTQENNYTVKLNNLHSGVYFVGNNLSRQKVVVIK